VTPLEKMQAALAGQGKMQDAISAVRMEKPTDFDAVTRYLHLAYLGLQDERTRAVLCSRYKQTGHRMPLVSLGVVREKAELDAQVYRRHAMRWIEPAEDGAAVAPEREAEFVAMLESARMDAKLQEAERIAMAAGAVFVRPRWTGEVLGSRKPPRIELDLYWPETVHALEDKANPGEIETSPLIVISLGGKDGGHEVWERLALDADGYRYRFARFDDKGERTTAWQVYGRPGHPFLALYAREPEAGLYPTPAKDLLNIQDQVNTALSDQWYRDSLEAHTQKYVAGDHLEKGREHAIGPDVVWSLEAGASVGQLSPNNSFATMTEGVQSLLNFAGKSWRHPEEAWRAKPGNPDSGISRQIKNEAADQKRQEHGAAFAAWEETVFLPFLADLSDAYAGTAIGGPDIRYRVQFSPPKVYETPAEALNRAKMAENAGYISPARGAVIAGLYPTLEDAQKAGLSNEIAPKMAPPPVFGAQNAENDDENDENEG
jgi:hypothetical protein